MGKKHIIHYSYVAQDSL